MRERDVGVEKERSAAWSGQHKYWTKRYTRYTIGCSCQGGVAVVAIPVRGISEGVEDIVHELQHFEIVIISIAESIWATTRNGEYSHFLRTPSANQAKVVHLLLDRGT